MWLLVLFIYSSNNPINYNDPSGHTTEFGLNDGEYCSKLIREYSESTLWRKVGLTKDQFVQAKEAYVYYNTHPQAALDDSVNDTDSYFWADTYSEYVNHQLFQLFGDDLVMQNIEKAHLSGDMGTYYKLLGGMAIMVWLEDSSGQKNGIKLENGITLETNQALDAASQFLGEDAYPIEPGRYVSKDGLRQVRMLDSDILGTHSGGRSHMNFEVWEPKPGEPGRFIRIANWHIYLK